MPYVYHQSTDDEGQYALGQTIEWDAFIDVYIEYLREKQCKPKHFYDVKNSLSHAARDFAENGITKPAGVNQHNARQHLRTYKNSGVADISVKHRKVKLGALFSWAWRVELYRTDKLAKLETPPVTDTKRHKPPSLEHLGLVVAQIRLDWDPEHAPGSRFKSEEARKFFLTRDVASTLGIAETGARVGEWFGTLRSNVDLKARTILWRNTKNGDDRRGYITEAYADGPFAAWLAIRNKIETGNDYLWITETGGRIDASSWGKQFNRYVQHAGIEEPIRRHDLRHLSSSAHDKVDRQASKIIIGHRSDAVHDIYSHDDEDTMLELRRVHDLANPVGSILTTLAEATKTIPAQKGRRVYTASK